MLSYDIRFDNVLQNDSPPTEQKVRRICHGNQATSASANFPLIFANNKTMKVVGFMKNCKSSIYFNYGITPLVK